MTRKTGLIVVGGFAGAGKTTIATALSNKYNFPVFSSDVINDALRPVLGKGFSRSFPDRLRAYVALDWNAVGDWRDNHYRHTYGYSKSVGSS